jgi:undecaprenyl pyrophosphate phosphatase UppP
LLKTLDLVKRGDATLGADAVIVAVLSTGLAWLAIRWMMRWFTTAGFSIFVYYRLALSGLLLLALAQGWVAPSIS